MKLNFQLQKIMAKAKRKYNNMFLDYGFTFIEKGGEQLLQYVICFRTLSNSSRKGYQLKQHLTNTHNFLAKPGAFSQLKAQTQKNKI